MFLKVGDTLNKSDGVIRKVKNVPNDAVNYTNNYIAAPIKMLQIECIQH